MRKQFKNDLVVDSEGNCFLCLHKIDPQVLQCPSSMHSLQGLVRFLKVDFDTSARSSVLPNVIGKLDKRILKVELCGECASLTERFSKLYQQLEKVKMEANYCVKLIHRKLLKAKVTGRAKQFHSLVDSEFEDCGRQEKLQLAKVLRIKTKEKCALKLRSFNPKVKLQKLRMQRVNAEGLKVETLALVSDMSCNSDDSDPNDNQPSGDDNDNPYLNEEQTTNSSHPSLKREPILGQNHQRQIAHSGKGRRRKNKRAKYTYKCNTCGKEFTRGNNLQTHVMTIHLELRQHSCDHCGKKFKQKAHLMKHLRLVHPNKRRPSMSATSSDKQRSNEDKKPPIKKYLQPIITPSKFQSDSVIPQSFDPDWAL